MKMNNVAKKFDYLGMHRVADAIDLQNSNPNDHIYYIPEDNMQTFIQKIQDLNIKVNKIKLKFPESHIENITWDIIGEIPREYYSQSLQRKIKGKTYQIKIKGASPRINDYEFISSIQHAAGDDGKYANFVINSPNVLGDPKYRTSEPKCEHCGYSRDRKQTYILKNINDNKCIQVGSTCLKDFLGHASPHTIAAILEHIQEAMQGLGENLASGNASFMATRDALVILGFLIDKAGFSPASSAQPTKLILSKLYYNTILKYENDIKMLQKELSELTEEQLKNYLNEGYEALKWAAENLKKENPSDFEWNLGVAAKGALSHGSVDNRKLGLFAYSLPAYRKYKKQQQESEKSKPTMSREEIHKLYTPASIHNNLNLTVTKIGYDFNYGFKRIFFVGPDNIKFQWNTTAKNSQSLSEGNVIIAKAKVKNFYTAKNGDVVILLKSLTF